MIDIERPVEMTILRDRVDAFIASRIAYAVAVPWIVNRQLPPLRFSICLPAGCLLPLAFNADAVTAMRAGTALKAKAAANGSGQNVNFSISLSGFTSALTRAAELTTQ